MNERINSISDLRFRSGNGDNDMGRRRLNQEKKLEDEKEKFETYFQEALKSIRGGEDND